MFISSTFPAFTKRLCWLLLLSAGIGFGAGQAHSAMISDVSYARLDEKSLELDLFLPSEKIRSPLILWVHGGAWRSGSRKSMPLTRLVEQGYAIASVDYRLSTEARFPAQIHDIKAAVRFLRGHGSQWQLPAEKILIAGDSAGGHLAALAGVSNGVKELEGQIGGDRSQNSDIQGIISFYGAANLTTILNQSTSHGLSVRVAALDLLLGAQPDAVPALARLASPVFHVDKNDPPLLLLHGDQDPQMPVNQALELWGAYRKANGPVQLEIIQGAAHGGPQFYDDERLKIVQEFLKQHFE